MTNGKDEKQDDEIKALLIKNATLEVQLQGMVPQADCNKHMGKMRAEILASENRIMDRMGDDKEDIIQAIKDNTGCPPPASIEGNIPTNEEKSFLANNIGKIGGGGGILGGIIIALILLKTYGVI